MSYIVRIRIRRTPSEYSNILNFAYHSPKWHDAYEWQIIGDPNSTHAILSHAAHPRSRGCPVPTHTIRNRNMAAFAASSVHELLYPSVLNPRNPSTQAGPIKTYVRASETSEEWRNYTKDRQKALYEYAKGRNVSAEESCPGILHHWTQCFQKLGAKKGVITQKIRSIAD